MTPDICHADPSNPASNAQGHGHENEPIMEPQCKPQRSLLTRSDSAYLSVMLFQVEPWRSYGLEGQVIKGFVDDFSGKSMAITSVDITNDGGVFSPLMKLIREGYFFFSIGQQALFQ